MEFIASIEGVEAESMLAYESRAPATLDCTAARIGGGIALSMRHDPVAYWSKALGFGYTEPITGAVVDRVVDFYRAAGTPTAVIQVAPSVLPPDWDEISARHGLRPMSPWLKLAAPLACVRPSGGTRLWVTEVGPDDAEEWAAVLLRGFGMPTDGLARMVAAAAGNPAVRTFGAWDGADLVGAAGLFVHGELALFNGAATLPAHRNQGVQTALITARLDAAQAAGCRWLVAETGKPAPGTTSPSLDNLLRAGLRIRYARQNWRWRNESTGENEHV
ncbi:GNAT family N-acetyltransferase [Asanoa iriomotensis]|uniref:Hypothetical acetyltransferase, GNAT family protein n=1 Tax=Asanoa iriomotensis TaxID=234613 RepID=A0ABQ4BWI5_9ACTN|nr:hypothetical acetyltransferase, GNAT family protein [Asanoa iriomotensis]